MIFFRHIGNNFLFSAHSRLIPLNRCYFFKSIKPKWTLKENYHGFQTSFSCQSQFFTTFQKRIRKHCANNSDLTKKLLSIDSTTYQENKLSSQKMLDTDVGICLKIHLHFNEEDLKAYPAKNTIIVTKGMNAQVLDDEAKNKNLLCGKCADEDKKDYPDYIILTLNLKLNDYEGNLKPGQMNLSHISVNGEIPFSKAIPGNVFIYNGIGNCKVKCD